MRDERNTEFERGSRIATALLATALAGMAYCHVKDVGMKFDEHVYYMAYLFCANIAASISLAVVAVMARASGSARWLRQSASAAIALAISTIAGFVWSRTIGFPQMADHIGDWDLLGITSLAFETVVIVSASALWAMTRPQPRTAVGSRRRLRIAVGGMAILAAAAALVVYAGTASADGSMTQMHYGDMSEYPDVAHASGRDLRIARVLHLRTNVASAGFDTVAKAERLGYRADRSKLRQIGCPGLLHWRKRTRGFLEPRRPQALAFWCDSNWTFTLVAAMYRAPREPLPPTYGDLLGWHRHSETGTWMTHVWLTAGTRAAFATCVPFDALAARLAITPETYAMGLGGSDTPCSTR